MWLLEISMFKIKCLECTSDIQCWLGFMHFAMKKIQAIYVKSVTEKSERASLVLFLN